MMVISILSKESDKILFKLLVHCWPSIPDIIGRPTTKQSVIMEKTIQ